MRHHRPVRAAHRRPSIGSLGSAALGALLAGAACSPQPDRSPADSLAATQSDSTAVDPAFRAPAESTPPSPQGITSGETPASGRADSARRSPDVAPSARPEPPPGSAGGRAPDPARPGQPAPRVPIPRRPRDATPSIPNPDPPRPAPPSEAPGASQDPTVARLEREGRALASTTGCASAGQCRIAPLGARACGGPREYIAYCPLTTDSARLFRKLAELERAERAYQQRAGIASICSLVMPPTPAHAGGRCTAGDARTGPQ